MDKEMLETIGTYVSVLALVISIVALAFQVRQHTRSLSSQNYGTALDRLAAVQARLGSDPAANSVFNRGVRDARALTPDERTQLVWILYGMFGAFEFMFDEAQRGALPSHVWNRWSDTVTWWVSQPGVLDWWRNRPVPFNTRFTAFVEECIRSPRVDAAGTERWEQFLAG
jgi:hypothetical protein